MNLKTIFQKPVDRPIEGVIKADDEASLRLEIEEYVLTNEVEKRLSSFLDAYNDYHNANGVWVSGFFGSGKSHLLKMLALVLENRPIDGIHALDLFLPKCGDDALLRASLQKAVSLPSRSILFNIDQKADVISKTQIDALLAVFVKVFDEMCGYYGKQGHIAQFERDLDSRDQYQDFQAAYQAIAGRSWHTGREQALLESRNIAQAYAQVTGGDTAQAQGILDKYRSTYRVSIEDFAQQVQAYIERQPPNFRLNFFVDEVGQYIADNIKLMTNLQTIAESLATKCRGRAWIIVTAQEEMDTVIGEMNARQGNDFTKIQARFANRMKLTSQDVAEVIQKRLLSKTEAGVQALATIYSEQSNNFKTLFDFADGTPTYQNFRDRDHFVNSYPFIPYQFTLFQSAIQNLSKHSAFEGKHSSVGERSMLGVFQQVAKHIADHELGQLATFDLMFEGIRTALKSNIQRAILMAESNLNHDFAIRLLKTLFLVKYVKEFKPSPRNLCVLMLDRFNQDLPALRKQVEEALALLEQQTYIQRNGDLYEYLTDEEKDIEQEIKDTEVETADVAAELVKLVFDGIIKQNKIRVDAGDGTAQDYAYTRKLDERLAGREHELCIHVISPFHDYAESEQGLQRLSAYEQESLVVAMPPDARLMHELLMLKRTDKYIQQNISRTQNASVKRILSDKGEQNRQRAERLRVQVHGLLGTARLMIAGSDIEVSGQEPQTRIMRGFQDLVTRVYPNLRMLRGIAFSESDIRKYLEHHSDSLVGNDATTLTESEQEMLAFIQSQKQQGIRVTVKTLLERFEYKPYGWPYAAVLCVLAMLWARGKVEARKDAGLLDIDALEQALRNTQAQGHVVLEPQIEFTASQVRGLKSFFEAFFNQPAGSNEAKALGQETAAALQTLVHDLAPLAAQITQYPFMADLQAAIAQLKPLASQPYAWFLTELRSQEDGLLDLKEQVIAPIQGFMGDPRTPGPQKVIYDDAQRLLKSEAANLDEVSGDEIQQIRRTLDDPHCYRGQHIQQLKGRVDALKARIQEKLGQTRDQALANLNDLRDRLQNTPEYQKLPPQRQEELLSHFSQLANQIQQERLVGIIRDRVRRFQDDGYLKLLERVADMAGALQQPEPATVSTDSTETDALPSGPTDEPEADNPPAPGRTTIAARSLTVSYQKAWVADEADVEHYLDSLRQALLQAIQAGHKVQV
ncbi:BREX system P-loop protein BrxC [Castellaniella caeni]|uniref:BREX system P-loop protein BrxC n=1 Tax=Castellaniella caeni TaxID=266123 RepID=UPI000832C6C5|nr:BREX system P-loop protein BrxC [Castellaniella caeni]